MLLSRGQRGGASRSGGGREIRGIPRLFREARKKSASSFHRCWLNRVQTMYCLSDRVLLASRVRNSWRKVSSEKNALSDCMGRPKPASKPLVNPSISKALRSKRTKHATVGKRVKHHLIVELLCLAVRIPPPSCFNRILDPEPNPRFNRAAFAAVNCLLCNSNPEKLANLLMCWKCLLQPSRSSE